MTVIGETREWTSLSRHMNKWVWVHTKINGDKYTPHMNGFEYTAKLMVF